jgi:hypothetical protein
MEGLTLNNEENKGIIPRMMSYIFERINESTIIEFKI